MVQIALSETPSADWKRLFYETQQSPSPDFPPRAVDISGHQLRSCTGIARVEAKTAGINCWSDRANQKESAMGEDVGNQLKRAREDGQREQQELASVNT